MSEIKEQLEKTLLTKDISALGDGLSYNLQISIAALLVYAAKADGMFSGNEFDAIMRALAAELMCPDYDSAEMIEVASYLYDNGKRKEDFTQILNQSLTQEQKNYLFTLITKVISSDGKISVAEQILAGELAKSLGIQS